MYIIHVHICIYSICTCMCAYACMHARTAHTQGGGGEMQWREEMLSMVESLIASHCTNGGVYRHTCSRCSMPPTHEREYYKCESTTPPCLCGIFQSTCIYMHVNKRDESRHYGPCTCTCMHMECRNLSSSYYNTNTHIMKGNMDIWCTYSHSPFLYQLQ